MLSRPVAYALVLALAAAPRLWLGWTEHGIFWPDEILQSLEQAHRFAFGYGFVPWEFQVGARSWVFPGLLGLAWKALAALGVGSAPALVITLKVGLAAWSVVGVWAAMRLAERAAGLLAAVACGLFAAALPPLVLFSHRAMPEVASAPLVALAVLLAAVPTRRRLILAGAAFGLATLVRYQNGPLALVLGVVVAARAGRAAGWYALGGAAVAAAGALVDLATWGAPFHSLRAYVHYNLLKWGEFGVMPATFYATTLWTSLGPAALPLGGAIAAGARRAPVPLLLGAASLALHSAMATKELRFVVPVLPLLLAVAGAGVGALGGADRRRAAVALGGAVALAAALGWHAPRLTFGDLGKYVGLPPAQQSPWRSFEGLNRMLWEAGRRPDLCGLLLLVPHLPWMGGYAYLHRDVPVLFSPDGAAVERNRPSASHAVGPAGLEAPFLAPLAEARGWALYRVAGEGCAPPPPGFDVRLPL